MTGVISHKKVETMTGVRKERRSGDIADDRILKCVRSPLETLVNVADPEAVHLAPVRQEALENLLNRADSAERIHCAFNLIIASFGMDCGLLIPASGGLPWLVASGVDASISPAFQGIVDNHAELFWRWLATMSANGAPAKWSVEQTGYPETLMRALDAHRVRSGIVIPYERLRCIVWLGGRRPLLSRTDFNELYVILSQVTRRLSGFGFSPSAKGILTPREIEALRWISEGKTSHEAAIIAGLSGHTVTAYVNNAMRKLDCVTRSQVVAKAVRLGLIE
jgi:DNA-binding CsgD family transcriptional regulator